MNLSEKGRKGIFDSEAAKIGYRLNKMCHSFNQKPARDEFLADEMAYCDKFGLNAAQKKAIATRSRADFTDAGGSLYFFGKFIRLYPGAGGNFDYSATVKKD